MYKESGIWRPHSALILICPSGHVKYFNEKIPCSPWRTFSVDHSCKRDVRRNCWQDTSICNQDWLLLFLYYEFLKKIFTEPRKVIFIFVTSTQCKVYVLSGNMRENVPGKQYLLDASLNHFPYYIHASNMAQNSRLTLPTHVVMLDVQCDQWFRLILLLAYWLTVLETMWLVDHPPAPAQAGLVFRCYLFFAVSDLFLCWGAVRKPRMQSWNSRFKSLTR